MSHTVGQPLFVAFQPTEHVELVAEPVGEINHSADEANQCTRAETDVRKASKQLKSRLHTEGSSHFSSINLIHK